MTRALNWTYGRGPLEPLPPKRIRQKRNTRRALIVVCAIVLLALCVVVRGGLGWL